MAKSELTRTLENLLYSYCVSNDQFVVEEVTMPGNNGIVDTISYQWKNNQAIWRCFEIKVSKQDFYSDAKLSFIGHYNYFVLTEKLYEQVKHDIPDYVGIYIPYSNCTLLSKKRAKKQNLTVEHDLLIRQFIGSLSRECNKAKEIKKGVSIFSNSQLFNELEKRSKYSTFDFFKTFKKKLVDQELNHLEEEVRYLREELQDLKIEKRDLLTKLEKKGCELLGKI